MIKFLTTFPLLLLFHASLGQARTYSADSLLMKLIPKQIGFPYSNNTIDSSGATLINFFKSSDSLHIDIVYSSGDRYNLSNDKWMRYRFNKYKQQFPNHYLIYVPVYFRFYLESGEQVPLNANIKREMERQIKIAVNKAPLLKPIVIDGYQLVH